MRILQINKLYHIHGGTDRYFIEISRLLEIKGYKVALFCMDDKRGIRVKWSKYFVSNIPLENRSFKQHLRLFFRIFYSVEARQKISRLLDDFKPDVIHLHDFYHYLSPSILLEFKKRNIPVVMTVHDYHLISPNRNLFHNGSICEIFKHKAFWKCIVHKCIKDSYSLSIVEVLEKYVHEFLGWDKKHIDYYIAPSLFMKKKLIEYHIPKEKIIHLPHFIDSSNYKSDYKAGDYILYFGRLSPEKGLGFLLDIMHKLPNIKLLIAGRGQEENSLKLKVKSEKLRNVEFLGFRDGKDLKNLIANCKFTVLPSLWYDVAPISILESFSCGKPVIASNIGGIPETVKDGFNGFLFEPGNVEDCAEKINRLWNNPALCRKLGRNAREYVEKNFGPEEHYEKLMKIYRKAIDRHKRN